jgi:AraC family transcriptional activator of pobA
MSKDNIEMHLLSGKGCDIIISPMSASYVPSEDEPNTYEAHRHDYYSLFLLEQGLIKIFVDNECVMMSGPSVLLVSPGQVHHPSESSVIKGWVMAFDGKIIDREVISSLEHSNSEICVLELNNNDLSFLNNLLSNLHYSVSNRISAPFEKNLLHSMVSSLYLKLANIHWSKNIHSEKASKSRSVQITQDFKLLVRNDFREFKKPSMYAEKLSISVTYLNDTVKKITGFSATTIIQQEVVGEAQRMLLHTGKSVKEIAFDLGFEDWKYFTRLFSKVSGRSPTAFRNDRKIIRSDIESK